MVCKEKKKIAPRGAARTKANRAQERQALGSLRDNRVQPKTLDRYKTAVRLFFAWLLAFYGTFPNDYEVFDSCLAEYAENLWQEGESRYLLGDTISVISHFIRAFRYRLPDSWKQHDTWGSLEPAVRATPLTQRSLLAMVGMALRRGEISMAACLLLGFHAVFRTCEILGLVKSDIEIDAAGENAILHLGLTKSGKRRNECESVMVADRSVIALLVLCLEFAAG